MAGRGCIAESYARALTAGLALLLTVGPLVGCAREPSAADPVSVAQAAAPPAKAPPASAPGGVAGGGKPPAPESPAPDLAARARPAPASAAAEITGRWNLVSYLSLSESLEVPVSVRTALEPPHESWDFASGGRFRRTLDRFAIGGRWSVVGELDASALPMGARGPSGGANPSANAAWLAAGPWRLVALDDVTLAQIPTEPRPREWALVTRDGDELLVVYLGSAADPDGASMGGRFVPVR